MKLSDLSRATEDRLGKVEKATSAEMDSGAADKWPDASEVKRYSDSTVSAEVSSHESTYDHTTYDAAVLKQKREELLAEATLSLGFANNRYSVFEGIGSGQTIVPYETALTHTRGSDATGCGVGNLETVGVDTKRLVRDPVTGKSQGLLVEEQRANLLLWSEDFTNAAWGKSRVTVSANSIESPDDTLTADKLVESADDGPHHVNQQCNYTAGVSYCHSVYVRAAERSQFAIFLSSASFGISPVYAAYDLPSETCTILSAGTNTSASIKSCGNGFYRVSLTSEATVTSTSSAQLRIANANSISYQGDGISGIYVWGAQIEEGPQPSSHIKTEASQVTRAGEQVSRTLGQEFNPREFTVLLSTNYISQMDNYYGILSITDGDLNNSLVDISSNGSGTVWMAVRISGNYVLSTNAVISESDMSESNLFAISFTGDGTCRAFANGSEVASGENQYGTVGAGLAMYVGNRGDSDRPISRCIYGAAAVIPRTLSETELQILTAPD